MLNMTCLGGSLIGKKFSLFEGLRLSNDQSDDITLGELNSGHYIIELNSEGMLTICSKESATPISSAGEKYESLTLIPGLIFGIGDSTFAVQKGDESSISQISDPENEKTFLDLAKTFLNGPESDITKKAITVLKSPVKIDFVRGFWMNQNWILQHCPIHIGRVSPIYFFPDESIDTKDNFLTFEYDSKNDSLFLTTSFESLIYVNGLPISNQEVFDGDFVEFGTTAFYININE